MPAERGGGTADRKGIVKQIGVERDLMIEQTQQGLNRATVRGGKSSAFRSHRHHVRCEAPEVENMTQAQMPAELRLKTATAKSPTVKKTSTWQARCLSREPDQQLR